MDQQLQFKIGTSFNGEGFTKLSKAAKASAGEVGKATRAAGLLTSSIGALDQSTNKLVTTSGNLLSGLLSMGPWGIAITAATTLVGWIVNIFNEEKRATEELDRMNNAWKTVEGTTAAYQRRVAKMRQEAKEAAEAEKKEAAEKAASEKRSIENMKKMQQSLDKEAEIKEKIANLDERSASAQAQMAVNIAKRKVDYEIVFGDKNSQRVANAELELAQAQLKNAIEKEAKEREEAAAAERQQREEQKAKFEEMREAMDEEIRQKKIKNQETQLAAAEKAASKSTEEVARAEQNLKNAIEAYKDNIAQNEINRSIGISSENSRLPLLGNYWGDLIKNRGLIQQEAGEVAVERGLANGSIRTVEDMRRARNAASKAANAQIDSQATKQEINEQQRADRLNKMIADGHEKAMSKADKDFLKDFNAAKQARDKQAQDIQKRQQELALAKQREEQSFKDIADIKKKLEQLGLK